MEDIYITKTNHFLPNKPISNDEMEDYLGRICDRGSRAKSIVLRNNRITNRHYALDASGKPTHTNAELTWEAIKPLFNHAVSESELDMLAVGTSTPDTIMPSHGLLVHSLMKEARNIPAYTSAGVCCSGMHALETVYRTMLTEQIDNGIAAGSELLSPLLKSDFFELELSKLLELKDNATIAFEKDFLRFMLSDGAGAFLLEKKMRPGLNYKIEWMDSISYANLLPACMYQGCLKDDNGVLQSWKTVPKNQWIDDSIFAIKQDTRILEHIVPYAVKFFQSGLKKRNLNPEAITHFLPHISSMYFYDKMINEIKEQGMDINEDIFYTCLPEVGNIGSASIYAALNLLPKMRDLKEGDLILLGVPESAQFQYSMALLKVVYN